MSEREEISDEDLGVLRLHLRAGEVVGEGGIYLPDATVAAIIHRLDAAEKPRSRSLTEDEMRDARTRADHEAHKWGYLVWNRVLDALDTAERRLVEVLEERDRLRATLNTILAWHQVKDDAEYDSEEGGEPETITYCAACHSTDDWCETELLISAALEPPQ